MLGCLGGLASISSSIGRHIVQTSLAGDSAKEAHERILSSCWMTCMAVRTKESFHFSLLCFASNVGCCCQAAIRIQL
jgi:hypothetical protein